MYLKAIMCVLGVNIFILIIHHTQVFEALNITEPIIAPPEPEASCMNEKRALFVVLHIPC